MVSISSISKIRQALSTPEYYDLVITQAVLIDSSSDVVDAVLNSCVEKSDRVVLPIRKLYGIEVEIEEEISVSEVQTKATDSLQRLTMAIAEKEGVKVAKVESTIKEYIDAGLSLSSLPTSWLAYHVPLSSAIIRILNGDGNKKAVIKLLNTRVDSEVDWSGIGENLVKEISTKFISQEQNAWENQEDNDASLGESSIKESVTKLQEQVAELITIVSTLTSSVGEQKDTTITVDSKRLQPA